MLLLIVLVLDALFTGSAVAVERGHHFSSESEPQGLKLASSRTIMLP